MIELGVKGGLSHSKVCVLIHFIFSSPSRPSFGVGEDKLELPLEVTLCNPPSSPEATTRQERQHFPSPPLGGSGGQTKAQPQTQRFILKTIYE